MNKVYLGLGTNMGNRLGYLSRACDIIENDERVFSVEKSDIYETEAWGYTEQNDFLNMCIRIYTDMNPQEVLRMCQSIEEKLNRKRIIKWGPRTIDVDVLLFNDEKINDDNLKVPHPYINQRGFVLKPLMDLDENINVEGKNIVESFELLDEKDKNGIKLYKLPEDNIFINQKKIRIHSPSGKTVVEFGRDNIVIAGPCAIESYEQLLETANSVKRSGANILRGGAFKPRTSPRSFSGLKKDGLEILKKVREITDMPVITEVMDIRDIDMIYETADILQIGSRNMQNFSLLKEIGKQDKPVMLKRGLSATINEWICSAEYIAAEGNENIIMCERGIRTYSDYTRNTMDISAIPVIKEKTGLPVIADPSHATGIRNLVEPMALASIVAGADGIMTEVHPEPEEALSDGDQSLTFDMFDEMMKKIDKIRKINL